MRSPRPARLTRRDYGVLGGLALASVLCASPGVHLAEVWLRHQPAVLLSHGAAALGLAWTARVWQSMRSRRPATDSRAVVRGAAPDE